MDLKSGLEKSPHKGRHDAKNCKLNLCVTSRPLREKELKKISCKER